MPRKIQATYTKSKNYKRFVSFGDSFTYNTTLGVLPENYYTAKLQGYLNALGCNVTGVNLGVSGNTTGQMLQRVALTVQFGVPEMAIIYGGTNDRQYATTVQASPTPTSTVFAVAAGLGQRYLAGTYILVGSEAVLIQSVATDTITLATPLSGGAPAAGTAVELGTQANLTAIGNYLRTAGCTRIIFCGQHYINWSAGGDTLSTPLSANVTLRNRQSAAAAAVTGAVYCDFYAYMRNLIVTGQAVQGSASWHVRDIDTHLNGDNSVAAGQLSGETIFANALLETIQAQSGWIDALN